MSDTNFCLVFGSDETANHRRLLEPIGDIPPAEAEQQFYAMLDTVEMAA